MTVPYCVIGCPVEHSLSPAIYEPLFRKYDVDASYGRVTVKRGELESFLCRAEKGGYGGFNATMPHKEDLLGLVELDESARFYGSVNTVVKRDGRFVGFSTDGEGFAAMLKERGTAIRGSRVLVAGSGGAASSVALALARQGASLVILSRTPENAEKLANRVNSRAVTNARATFGGMDAASVKAHIKECGIYVNCTPLGMVKSGRDYDDFSFLDGFSGTVCDLVYMPKDTALLKQAALRGLDAAGGIGMLIRQGLLAFELYTGICPDESDVSLVEDSIRKEGYDI